MANTYSLDLEASSSQYASITDASQTGLDITGDITMEAWVKMEQLPSTAGNTFGIINKDSAYKVFINSSDDKLWFISTDDGTYSAASQIQSLTDAAFDSGDVGEWIHVAAVVDVSTPDVTFYINGTSVARTMTQTGGTSIYNSTGDVSVGKTNDAGQYLDGLIDECRIWNDVRTGTEISDNYNVELDGDEAGLVGYWKFNNNYLDETSNDNDLTASGSPTFSSDVPFTGNLTLIVDTMALTLTYANVTLTKATKLVVDTMALTLTFADVIFDNARTIIVDTMALSLNFADVVLSKTSRLVVDTMSLLLDFKDVVLKKTGWSNDTKPTSAWTEDSKPSSSWNNDSK